MIGDSGGRRLKTLEVTNKGFFISLGRLLLEIQPGCEFLGSFGLGGAVSRWIHDEGEGLAKTRPDNGNGSMVVRLDSVAN